MAEARTQDTVEDRQGPGFVDEDVEGRVRREDAARFVQGVGHVLLFAAVVVPGLIFVEALRSALIEPMPIARIAVVRIAVGAALGVGAWWLLKRSPSLPAARLVDLGLMALIAAMVGWLEGLSRGTDVYIPSLVILVFVRTSLVPAFPIQAALTCFGAWVVMLAVSALSYPPEAAQVELFWPRTGGRHVFVLICIGIAVWSTRIMTGLSQREVAARSRARYQPLEAIGEGGMGRVLRARDVLLERDCALKMLTPARSRDAESLRSFEREAKVTGRLRSPHSVRIYDFGRTRDGQLFFVMELLRGRDLQQLIEAEGPQEPERVARWLRQAASALHEAHGQGLVHRDVKPANLFLTEDVAGEPYVKVLDFGLSLLAEEQSEAGIQGTPDYMAPEQARGAPTDPRGDIYALGAVGFHLLTGEALYTAASPMGILMQHLDGPVRRPSELTSRVPPLLDETIARCLAKAPGDRFPSMRAVADALGAL